ncbi:hypothetical protein PanWU01x14_229940 [Parasponia andersonii]|uniref:Uncharacterized protein n=1 Tax=Parasponia andersonii TaxID=3476 RepID=A0A2P5BL17_PARAD|nr:hypothetical protein PanWU01x14_229940 [Parasponia andersonii]
MSIVIDVSKRRDTGSWIGQNRDLGSYWLPEAMLQNWSLWPKLPHGSMALSKMGCSSEVIDDGSSIGIGGEG